MKEERETPLIPTYVEYTYPLRRSEPLNARYPHIRGIHPRRYSVVILGHPLPPHT